MTSLIAGWQRRMVDGGVLMVPPPAMHGAIRIRTGQPLRPARDVVQDLIRPGYHGAAFDPAAPPRAFTTHEGEHAAIFELLARAPTFQIRRAVAVLFGDESLVVIDGRMMRPEDYDISAKVHTIAREFTLG